jgi:Zn-dependent peptidase ImmA (M78 family)
MTIIDPGLMFLKTYCKVEAAKDVLAYVDFLRKESGLDGLLPVNLVLIYHRFQIPDPIQRPLPGQQGLLVDAKNGIILINSNDPPSRQKFSQAHELVEFLFNALPNGKDLGNGWLLKKPGGFKEAMKEYLCNWAAANLLMPPDYVDNRIKQYGANFECARAISDECEISLSAALVQLARISPGNHSIVLWTLKNKPSEIKSKIPDNQLGLFDNNKPEPAKKLRVKWSMRSASAHFIPKDKSVEETSLVYESWQTDAFTSGKERLCLDGRKSAWYQTQNFPFDHEGETQVLSLIEYLG